MGMDKKFILPVLIGAVGLTFAGGAAAHAQTASTTTQYPSIVQEIASKFNLTTADVQSVFDQNRTEMQAQMKAKSAAALDQAVTDGKITADQKQQILDERQKLEDKQKANMANFKSLTADQRRAAMEATKAEVSAWTKQTGIDAKYLMGGFEFRRGFHGGEMGHLKGDQPFTQPVT